MNFSISDLLMFLTPVDDQQRSRFRRRLKERASELCPNYGVAEAALRRVFEEQLDYPNLLFSDDLLKNDNDLPIEEILIDAFELLGINATPTCDSWNGAFGDLVRVLDEKVAKVNSQAAAPNPPKP